MDNVDTRETRLVAEWSAALAAPGERFLSWALLGYAKPPGQAGRNMMTDYLATRGLDPARQVALLETQAFAVLTDATLRLGLYGGMFRFKPKTLVATSGAAGFRLEWWDESRMVADERHMLMLYDDGSWSRHSAMVTRRSNVEVFVEALGDRAVRIER
jgi:hypothetical protein